MNGLTPPPPRLTPGRILYLTVHRPLGVLRTLFRHGGPWVQWRTARGEAQMRAAVASLPVPPPTPATPRTVHLLTGARYWHQTAFCLWSFAHQSSCELAPVIHDDGSLTVQQRDQLARLFPRIRFFGHAEASALVALHLPLSRYPTLRDRWLHYPHIRKLINPHLGSRGAKLVLDSDLLFFRRPTFLLDWLDRPDRPLHAVDTATAYGYPIATLDSLAGAPLAPLVNVGLTGLISEEIDWDRLEHWTRVLVEKHGTHYVLEQALVAMLVAGRPCAVAPAEDYVTLPRPPEATACRAVMHHYVADSKRWYFQVCWRQAASRLASS